MAAKVFYGLRAANQTRDDEIMQTHDWTLRALLSVVF